MTLKSIISSATTFILTLCASSASLAAIEEVDFTHVELTDNFWAPRIEINRTVSIPSAFEQCEKAGRFDNFALAAGLIQGEHKGDFSFDDTDPYKIIEGASYALAVKYDPKLDAYLDSVINLIARAQEPDGYLTTCVTNRCERLKGWWGSSRWEKINSHELYNSGHLYEAAVAHFKATGKRSLLDVAIRNADLVCQVFGPGENQKHVPSGHPIIEMALCKLYKVTGEKRYLDMARYFVEETGRGTDGHRLNAYSQDHKPILDQEEIVGHAVRAGYLFSGVADVASLTEDPAYFDAINRIWNNMASRKLYITGGIGSRAQGEGFGPEYELHNHTAYCETCAAIANVYWNYRMFLATGDAAFADVYERALYNGVISGVSLSGDRFFYDNPLESMGEHERAPWFGCACCPGNVTRFIASIPGYMYATAPGSIYVNLYATSQGRFDLDNEPIGIQQHSDMPWSGKSIISVNPEKSKKFAVRLRIPGWAADAPVPTDLYKFYNPTKSEISVLVNGRRLNPTVEKGYLVIEREWKPGDKIELSLPLETRWITTRDEVADNRGKIALQRGPIVYCLEGVDQEDSWIFDKFVTPGQAGTVNFEPDLLGGIMTISLNGYQRTGSGVETVHLKAIPYATWNNRGPAQMMVWMPADYATATEHPAPSLASIAEMYSEPTVQSDSEPAATSNLSFAWGYNDQWEPASSADTSKPYHYWWLRRGTKENVCYRWSEPQTVSQCDLYWLDFDHYDGDFRVPKQWKVFYLDDKGFWQEIETDDTYGTEKDRYNSVAFKPVTTTALKVEAQLQPGVSGGVMEWKVK